MFYINDQFKEVRIGAFEVQLCLKADNQSKVFYKNAAVCILVYDITRKKSFEELKNYWVNEIKANASPNLCN